MKAKEELPTDLIEKKTNLKKSLKEEQEILSSLNTWTHSVRVERTPYIDVPI